METYINARYYVPTLNRFASADTIVPNPSNPQSYNRYSYVRNNPINLTDPTGHKECGSAFEASCMIPRLPESERFYCTENYGCFDKGHINPAGVIDIFRQLESGNHVRISKPLASGVPIWFSSEYEVSEGLSSEELKGAVLGILTDFELRFEEWQGTIPVGPGAKSSFAIEDLPSDYIGFYIGLNYSNREFSKRVNQGANYDIVLAEVFESLGGVTGVGSVPHPLEFVIGSPIGPVIQLPTIRYIDNTEFAPLVDNGSQWVNVAWPNELQMTPLESSPTTWQNTSSGTCIGGANKCH